MCTIKSYPALSYKLVNNVTGWVAFLIASVSYILTVEPTVSLWDCGEFISTSVGLQVGHPPGAPLFMIISRLFAFLAPSPDKQALMINVMSALASAFTVLFLFWTITYLARRLVLANREECSVGQLVAIMGAGMVGALAYAFADTPWFSAVEGEVYALSSLLTAVVFWAILKWESVADEPYANRWLVFIAYLTGLSIGIHLLNLLVIPSIAFIYYFKRYTPSVKGVLLCALASIVILGAVLLISTQWLLVVAGWFELAFVNGFGLPFNTGVAIYALLLIGGLAYGIRYTLKRKHTLFNTVLTCFAVILIGFSSYAMVVIRSVSNPPIDENSPDNVFALLSYIQREQYGQNPLFRGPYYNAPPVDLEEGTPVYMQNEKTGKYEVIDYQQRYVYDKRFTTLFPRIYSPNPDHVQGYKQWGGEASGPTYWVDDKSLQAPSFWNNLKFLFNYQIGHMYVRYFMWNFSGRQNDIQGNGDFRYGNWITGIPFVDEMLVGNQKELPDRLKHNKARNCYYMLPLLLGLVGLAFQYKQGQRGKQDFWVVMLFFFFTGIAIVLYLNQKPYEPRERDYAYAGSFYAFAIWIGLGVLSLWKWLQKQKMPVCAAAWAVSMACLIVVPVNMAAENWDDHDRSGRYATLAHAKNYLNSCAPNAILFTFGDNDTFPLWYAQEVEGIRRDIRVVNLSLLASDWYTDQMKRRAYESPAVPISLTREQYYGKRNQILIQEQFDRAFSLKDVMEFVKSDRPESKISSYDYIPTRKVYVPVSVEKVIANGTVRPEDADKIVSRLDITLPKKTLYKNDLMVLDIIATNDWERPIYFGIGMGTDTFLGFDKYFQLEGAAYRLVPIENQDSSLYGEMGRINTRTLYNNLMNNFEWGNIKDSSVNIDNFHSSVISIMRYRGTFGRLAETLLDEAITDGEVPGLHVDTAEASIDTTKVHEAVRVLDRSLEEIPLYQMPVDHFLLDYVRAYYRAGEYEKGNTLARSIIREQLQELKYFWSLSPRQRPYVRRDENTSKTFINILLEYVTEANQTEFLREIDKMWEETINPLLQQSAAPSGSDTSAHDEITE
ncbi:MAG: DUF2723 domain-containing protein [Odoribacteraceae bacterium]|jgi:hypothetical protein|nr:DUF2723 domain-containing protein [Odoribacteraceae bacterium]